MTSRRLLFRFRFCLLFLPILAFLGGALRIDVEVMPSASPLGIYPASLSFQMGRHANQIAIRPERCITEMAWERCGARELTVYIEEGCRQPGAPVALVFSFRYDLEDGEGGHYLLTQKAQRRSVADPVHFADCVAVVRHAEAESDAIQRFLGSSDTLHPSSAVETRFLAMRHLCRIDGTQDAVWALELVDANGRAPATSGTDQVAFLHFGNTLWLSGSASEHRAVGLDRLIIVPGEAGMSVQVVGPQDTQGMRVSGISGPARGTGRPFIFGTRSNMPCFCNSSAMCSAEATAGQPPGSRATLQQIAVGVPGPIAAFGLITRANWQGTLLFNGAIAVISSGLAAFFSLVVFGGGIYFAFQRRAILMRPTKPALNALRDLGL